MADQEKSGWGRLTRSQVSGGRALFAAVPSVLVSRDGCQ